MNELVKKKNQERFMKLLAESSEANDVLLIAKSLIEISEFIDDIFDEAYLIGFENGQDRIVKFVKK